MTNLPDRGTAPICPGSCDARPVSWYFACDLPFCLVLNGAFSASIGVGVAHFDFTVVRQESKDPRVGEGQYDLEPDRYGLASYSHLRCELAFDTYLALSRSLGVDHTDQSAVAVFLVNRVLRAYRHAAAAYWVRPLPEDGLFLLETGTIDEAGTVCFGVQHTWGGMKVTLPKKALGREAQQVFVEGLAIAGNPPIWRELLLDAEDSYQRGQFRTAVIDAHTAIETLCSAVVLAALRVTYNSVAEAIAGEAVTSNLAKTLAKKKFASLEEMVADASDSVIFAKALEKSAVGKAYEEGPILRGFEDLAHARNAAVHQGGDVSPEEARQFVSSAHKVASLLVDAFGEERLAKSRAAPVKDTLTQYLGVPIESFLGSLLEKLESSADEVQLKRTREVSPPLGSCVFESCRVQYGVRQVVVFVPPYSKRPGYSEDVQAELAEQVVGHSLVLDEGWPNADVMSSAPVDHEAYSAAANLLTQVALTQEVVARCRSASYDPSPGLSRFLESQLVCASERFGGQQPVAYSYDYFVLPLLLTRLQFHKPEELRDNLLKLVEGMKWVTDVSRRLAEVSSHLDLRCRTDAATWILASKAVLLGGDYDTIGIREDPDRRLRTRLTPEEIARLGWRRR